MKIEEIKKELHSFIEQLSDDRTALFRLYVIIGEYLKNKAISD